MVLEPDTATWWAPAKFGDQATADHLIKDDGEKEESSIRVDTFALVILGRDCNLPRGTKSADHTIEAFQHFAGKNYNIACFYCENAPS